MIVFGHWKCSGVTGYVSGHQKGFWATPGKLYGPYGPRGETHQPQRGWCPPHMGWPNWRRKGEGGKEKGNRISPSPSSLPTPNRNRKGVGRIGRTPSRIPPTWGAPFATSPPLQPIYMWGPPLEHTPTIVSHVRRPLHSLRVRSYSRSA